MTDEIKNKEDMKGEIADHLNHMLFDRKVINDYEDFGEHIAVMLTNGTEVRITVTQYPE